MGMGRTLKTNALSVGFALTLSLLTSGLNAEPPIVVRPTPPVSVPAVRVPTVPSVPSVAPSVRTPTVPNSGITNRGQAPVAPGVVGGTSAIGGHGPSTVPSAPNATSGSTKPHSVATEASLLDGDLKALATGFEKLAKAGSPVTADQKAQASADVKTIQSAMKELDTQEQRDAARAIFRQALAEGNLDVKGLQAQMAKFDPNGKQLDPTTNLVTQGNLLAAEEKLASLIMGKKLTDLTPAEQQKLAQLYRAWLQSPPGGPVSGLPAELNKPNYLSKLSELEKLFGDKFNKPATAETLNSLACGANGRPQCILYSTVLAVPGGGCPVRTGG
jgi:hypothetical protein